MEWNTVPPFGKFLSTMEAAHKHLQLEGCVPKIGELSRRRGSQVKFTEEGSSRLIGPYFCHLLMNLLYVI
jgi:hypothetical protein